MTLSQILRKLAQLAGCALLIQALFLFAPAAAYATCGDYLTFHAPSAHHQSLVENQQPYNPFTLPSHKTCSGPQCSQAPASPMPSVPAPAAPQTFQDWACILSVLRRVPLDAGSRLSEESEFCLFCISSDIFHPPR